MFDAPGLIEKALAGERPRGAQDDMLKIEKSLPGFGGFYVDSMSNIVVYMKPSSHAAAGNVRRVLGAFYAEWHRAKEKEIMGAAVSASVKTGDFSLSELIAVENKIGRRLLSTPGIAGVGVSLQANRVIVGFTDSSSIRGGVETLVAAGIPEDAIVPEVWGEIMPTATFSSRIRNTRGGIEIQVGRRDDPYGSPRGASGTHGFTILTSGGTKYFMTAAHLANQLWGQNGKTGDAVYQPALDFGINNQIGTITVSAPYQQFADCPIDDVSGATPEYCSDADVALGTFIGADGDRKVATSTYEGQNGNPGNPNINGYYPISGIIDPEYVVSNPTIGVHKSGYKDRYDNWRDRRAACKARFRAILLG